MRAETLKENKDFRRLYYRGKSRAGDVLVTYAMKNRSGCCRIGITTSKKIGNAVERNRSRRVIRAAFSELEAKINGSYDFVFVARSKTSKVKMQEVLSAMTKHFAEMGIINEQA